MHFCPFCATLLVIESGVNNRLICVTCNYLCPVNEVLTVTHDFTKDNKKGSEIEETLAVGDGPEGGQIITIPCESGECESDKAYFTQLQMRGGDEAQTTFFKCTVCGFLWKD
eukprot:GILJ01020301.1.p1 GENE.GILJ01020301.1~~GILJ01020301.1.p1  ORF type:complete len:112 (-),score=0.82 GILJ01020301.1:101-436(-)